VRGSTLADAQARLGGQPLQAQLRYRPANAGERLGIVVGQSPVSGVLSAYSRVTLVLPRALHGVIPALVGLSPAQARTRLAPLHMQLRVSAGGASGGRIVSQSPPEGAAAAPGLAESVRLGPGSAG